MLKVFKDLVDEATVATVPESIAHHTSFISKRDPFLYAADRIIIADGASIPIYDGNAWRQIVNRGTLDLNAVSFLDTGGQFNVGWDYYIYLCLGENNDPEIVISANATYPYGFTVQNSRKIGGFHYGHIRHVSDDGKWIPVDSAGTKRGGTGTIWQRNVSVGIIPNSVWDLRNRPACAPEGMVKVGNKWVDIYISSAAEAIVMEGSGLSVVSGKLQSKYGQLPVTGTEGLNWYGFSELASLAGKWMMTYSEWIAAARDNPQGEDGADNYGWTKTTNTARQRTGCNVDAGGNFVEGGGLKPFAVSAFNIVDAVGNVYEWLDEQTYREDGGAAGWAWRDILGTGKGQAYLYKDTALVSLKAGGNWYDGVCAGTRAVNASGYPWNVAALTGVRLACDAA
ncbi:hypothetical protein AGMMS50268_09400 [Spirochaetia bacterium]|nr:hypothetical protein AGMMS50268_09400 [Spirochaetia bacterium]